MKYHEFLFIDSLLKNDSIDVVIIEHSDEVFFWTLALITDQVIEVELTTMTKQSTFRLFLIEALQRIKPRKERVHSVCSVIHCEKTSW